MPKTVLITGSTDGIGLLTARMLAEQGHHVLLHGRSRPKLEVAAADVRGAAEIYIADLSSREDVTALARDIRAKHDHLDVLINNAGVFHTASPVLADGQDVRFVVNTLAPYRLTHDLLPIIPADGRVINLSSAAQAPVNIDALRGDARLDDMGAYSQSKLAITIWSRELAAALPGGPTVIAVNPGSLLATKMVQEGFGVAGNDLRIGADILRRLALDDEFAAASGRYWDNDAGGFGTTHPAAHDAGHVAQVMAAIKELTAVP
ncbi:MAG: SDR family NAD(P)-dependent oxidoreductase [Pseudomonadota bacterium]